MQTLPQLHQVSFVLTFYQNYRSWCPNISENAVNFRKVVQPFQEPETRVSQTGSKQNCAARATFTSGCWLRGV